MAGKLHQAWRWLVGADFQERGEPRSGSEGFTLVEIIMVLVVLSIGVLPIAVIQHQARRQVTVSDHYTEAVTTASAQLERIKGLGFGVAVPDSGLIGNVSWVAHVNNVSFGLDQITVTAVWDDGGVASSLTITDLVSMR